MVGAGAFHSMRHSYLSRSIPIVLIQYHIISEHLRSYKGKAVVMLTECLHRRISSHLHQSQNSSAVNCIKVRYI